MKLTAISYFVLILCWLSNSARAQVNIAGSASSSVSNNGIGGMANIFGDLFTKPITSLISTGTSSMKIFTDTGGALVNSFINPINGALSNILDPLHLRDKILPSNLGLKAQTDVALSAQPSKATLKTDALPLSSPSPPLKQQTPPTKQPPPPPTPPKTTIASIKATVKLVDSSNNASKLKPNSSSSPSNQIVSTTTTSEAVAKILDPINLVKHILAPPSKAPFHIKIAIESDTNFDSNSIFSSEKTKPTPTTVNPTTTTTTSKTLTTTKGSRSDLNSTSTTSSPTSNASSTTSSASFSPQSFVSDFMQQKVPNGQSFAFNLPNTVNMPPMPAFYGSINVQQPQIQNYMPTMLPDSRVLTATSGPNGEPAIAYAYPGSNTSTLSLTDTTAATTTKP